MSFESTESILRAIREVVGSCPASLHEPFFGGNEANYVTECVESGWVSSVGTFVDRFERELAEYTESEHAVACSNGTSALLVALLLAGVNKGDEVIVPAMTFVATPNAVSQAGGIPNFADVDRTTLGLDPCKLREYLRETTRFSSGRLVNKKTGRNITAVVPMHCFGHMCDIAGILDVADEFRLAVVEDAAESLGSTRDSRHAGTFGRLGMVSFNGNKILTTGGGGAILTQDKSLAQQAKHLTTTAKLPHAYRFYHDCIAYNFRMPNLNAALGCGQFEQLPTFVNEKRRLAQRYRDAFEKVGVADFVREPDGCRSNYWLNAILLRENSSLDIDHIIQATNEEGIMTRPVWELMCDLPMYRDSPSSDLTTSRSLASRLINLPSGFKVAIHGNDMANSTLGCLPE